MLKLKTRVFTCRIHSVNGCVTTFQLIDSSPSTLRGYLGMWNADIAYHISTWTIVILTHVRSSLIVKYYRQPSSKLRVTPIVFKNMILAKNYCSNVEVKYLPEKIVISFFNWIFYKLQVNNVMIIFFNLKITVDSWAEIWTNSATSHNENLL